MKGFPPGGRSGSRTCKRPYNRPAPQPGGPVFPGCLILGQLARQPSFWLPCEAGRSAKSGSFVRPEETPARRFFPGPGSEGNSAALSRLTAALLAWPIEKEALMTVRHPL